MTMYRMEYIESVRGGDVNGYMRTEIIYAPNDENAIEQWKDFVDFLREKNIDMGPHVNISYDTPRLVRIDQEEKTTKII